MSFAVALILAAAAQVAPPAVFVLSPDGERMVMEPPPPEEPADEPRPPAGTGVKAGAPYRMVDLKGVGRTVTASADGGTPRPGCAGDELPTIPFDTLPPFEAPIMLVPGDWAAAPRTVTTLNATDLFLKPIVTAALADPKAPDVVRGTALKADLNGDGVDETIISATSIAGDSASPKVGDYTVLTVEWSANGRSSVLPIESQRITAENVEYGEVNWEAPQIVAIADLDGDGMMELIAVIWGYEQMDVVAWSFAPDGTPRVAYTAGCAV